MHLYAISERDYSIPKVFWGPSKLVMYDSDFAKLALVLAGFAAPTKDTSRLGNKQGSQAKVTRLKQSIKARAAVFF